MVVVQAMKFQISVKFRIFQETILLEEKKSKIVWTLKKRERCVHRNGGG